MFPRHQIFGRVLLRNLPAIAFPWLCLAIDARAATVEVEVRDFEFAPPTITIQPGDTVRWKFVSPGHTATTGTCGNPDGLFDSGFVAAGGTASFTFNQAGTFPYICKPHCSSGMAGTVKVAGGPPPAGNNKPPVLKLTVTSNSTNKQPRKIDEGETVTIKAIGFDRSGDPVTLEAAGLPSGSDWAPASGKRAKSTFTWTPEPGTAISQPVVTLNFSVTDSPSNGAAPLTTTQSITLNIGQNQAPELDPIEIPTAIVGKKLKLPIRASDEDGDKLKFSAEGLPPGAKLKAKGRVRGIWTAVLVWKPKPAQAGQSFPFTITVRDNFLNPAQDSREATLTAASP